MIAPEKKSVEHLRTAPSMRIKRKIKVKPTGLAAILCSGFAFNSITFYSLLEIFSNSSETIKTEGPAFCYFPGERSCILGLLETGLLRGCAWRVIWAKNRPWHVKSAKIWSCCSKVTRALLEDRDTWFGWKYNPRESIYKKKKKKKKKQNW